MGSANRKTGRLPTWNYVVGVVAFVLAPLAWMHRCDSNPNYHLRPVIQADVAEGRYQSSWDALEKGSQVELMFVGGAIYDLLSEMAPTETPDDGLRQLFRALNQAADAESKKALRQMIDYDLQRLPERRRVWLLE